MADPVTTAEAKLWMRVSISTDDTLIASLITAATTYLEGQMNREFIDETLILKLDRFLNEVELPGSPLDSVTSVVYIDTSGDTQTVSTDVFTVDTVAEPGVLRLGFNQTWPIPRTTPNAVTVTYVSGYGAAGSDVPEEMKTAIKILVAHWYENREAVVVGTITKEIELSVESLIWKNKVPEANS